jgi:hypothetical protein
MAPDFGEFISLDFTRCAEKRLTSCVVVDFE